MKDILDDDILEALKIAEQVRDEMNTAGVTAHQEITSENNDKSAMNDDNKNIPSDNIVKKNIPKKLKDPWSRSRKLVTVFIILLLMLVVLPGIFLYVIYNQGKQRLESATSYSEVNMGVEQDSSGKLVYNGKTYTYNQDIITILCVAVDSDGFENKENSIRSPDALYDDETGNWIYNEEENANIMNRDDEICYTDDEGAVYKINSPQIDMCFLLVINRSTNETNIIYINRDIMSDVAIKDINGDVVLAGNMQLTLAYAYGDGDQISITNTMNTISDIMYGLPINGYIVTDISTISDLDEAVRGVTLIAKETVCEDVYENNSVTLNGEQALAYVESMNTVAADIGENSLRIDRQKQYISAWCQRFVQKNSGGDKEMGQALYSIFKEKMKTNLDNTELIYLYSIMRRTNFAVDSIEELPGKYTRTVHFDEYQLNDEELKELIFKYYFIESSH
jgi:anionic cell wall polymer biosynthesis LytR-Cps2A-Psr (LCP) family protein